MVPLGGKTSVLLRVRKHWKSTLNGAHQICSSASTKQLEGKASHEKQSDYTVTNLREGGIRVQGSR